MQNLNLSRQPVSPALLQLAQSDAKWHKVRHIPPGGGAGRGGLGFGAAGVSQGRASVALTSAMLASNNFKRGGGGGSGGPGPAGDHQSSITSSGSSVSSLPPGLRGLFHRATAANADSAVSSVAPTPSAPVVSPAVHQQPAAASADYAANPYMAGHSQGRGRHLTQPAWMTTASSGAAGAEAHSTGVTDAGVKVSSSPPQFADAPSSAPAAMAEGAGAKRKSRFDDPATALAAPLVSGFVRASSGVPVLAAPQLPTAGGTTLSAAASTAGVLQAYTAASGAGMNSDVAPAQQAPPPSAPTAKRSRWDT